MADAHKPYQIIDDLAISKSKLSDTEVLAELAAILPLPDESVGCWADDSHWHDAVYPYLALCNVAAARRLRAAIPLILDRACFGDPGETMRGLCHYLEAIVKPDWTALTEPCVMALESSRPGTRLWAAHELSRLRDPTAIHALERATQDAVPEVRKEAASALDRSRA